VTKGAAHEFRGGKGPRHCYPWPRRPVYSSSRLPTLAITTVATVSTVVLGNSEILHDSHLTDDGHREARWVYFPCPNMGPWALDTMAIDGRRVYNPVPNAAAPRTRMSPPRLHPCRAYLPPLTVTRRRRTRVPRKGQKRESLRRGVPHRERDEDRLAGPRTNRSTVPTQPLSFTAHPRGP
jgi:hypothetical protein